MHKLKLIFAGSGSFGLPTLRALEAAGHTLAAVYTQPDRPAGRGKKLTPTPIAQYCDDRKLPVVRTVNINKEVLPAADAMVVIAFGQKISQAVVGHTPLQAINLHASILPKYRGAAPIQRALMSGETTTGNTIIRLADKMDAGKVLAVSQLAIHADETADELHDRLAENGAPLVLETLANLSAGTASETEQDHSRATHAAKISRADSLLDFKRSAREVSGMFRGLSPWPGCRVELHAGATSWKFAVLRCKVAEGPGPGVAPGEFCRNGKELFFGAGDGAVQIIDIQPENSKPMSIFSYLNGRDLPQRGHVVSVL